MTYENEKEISAIRADVEAAGIQVTEEDYAKADAATTSLKESGLYFKMEIMYAPPFMIPATTTEPARGINLIRHFNE